MHELQDIRICFVGDSHVNGTGDPDFLGWSGRLCASAASLDYSLTYYNLEVRRETSDHIARRWFEECSRRLPASVDRRIVFSFGGNDTAIENGTQRVPLAVTLRNLKEIVERAKGSFEVLFVGPAPMADIEHNFRLEQLDQAMEEEVLAFGVPYLAVFDTLRQSEAWMTEVASSDGSHPGRLGYEAFAGLMQAWHHWWFHPSQRG